MNYILAVILYRIYADISIVSEKILCIPVPLFEKLRPPTPSAPTGHLLGGAKVVCADSP